MKQVINDLFNILGINSSLQTPMPDIQKKLPVKYQEIVNLYCRIAGISNWEYLLQVHQSLIFVLEKGLEKLSIPIKSKLAFLKQGIEAIEFLASEYKRIHYNPKKAWPNPPSYKTKFPRYAFLTSGFIAGQKRILKLHNNDGLPGTFRSICLDVLSSLIALERQGNSATAYDKTNSLANLVLSARTLIKQNPNLVNTNLKPIIKEGKDAIAAFYDRHIIHANRNDYQLKYSQGKILSLREKFIYRHMRNLITLYKKQVTKGRPAKPLLSRSQKIWLKRNKSRNEHIARSYSRPLMDARLLQASIKQGMAPADLESEYLIGMEPDEYRYKKASYSLIYQHEEATAWSKKVPGYNLLAKCYKNAFCHRWDDMSPPQRLAAFKVMIYLHTGIIPEILSNIKVGNRRVGRRLLETDGVYLDVERLCFTSLLPVQLHAETLLSNLQWDKRGIVEAPLPPLLRQMLKNLLTDFPASKMGKQWIPTQTQLPNILPHGVSALKLTDSFERYYSGRYGLEPELMSLIAGMPVLGRNSSVHYFRTTYQRLESDYHYAFQKFHNDIISASGMPELRDRFPKIEMKQSVITNRTVGSLFHPKLDEISQYLAKLRKRLAQIIDSSFPDFSQWREVLALYSFEVLRIATGVRAMNNPPFHKYSIMSKRWLQLQDKGSGWRLVPLHHFAVELYEMLVRANQKLWVSQNGSKPSLPHQGVFFVERNGIKEPLNHSTIISTARMHSIEYPVARSNAHRHLMRSWIHSQGLSRKISDWVLGHKQNGPDTMDSLSMTPMSQMKHQFLGAVQNLFEELGITVVPDWS